MSAASARAPIAADRSTTVALVAMPWSSHTRPSAALGSLLAYARRELPRHDIVARSEYVQLASAVGFDLYDALSSDCYGAGEPLYMAQVYPERREPVRDRFLAWTPTGFGERSPADLVSEASSWGDVYDWLELKIGEHLNDAADRLSGVDVVGLTTCFGQLFSNIALAMRIKERSPETVIILGGSTVSGRTGPSLLEEYRQIDFIVQGEGERPLVALLAELAGGEPAPKGVVSRRSGPSAPATLWEVERLDDLPTPDFQEYAALAQELGIYWSVPVEGSRGCWWDRTKRSGNARATCYFCNLNVQWNGYREKSISRLVGELDELTGRYENTNVYFLDNIIRVRGVSELARGLASLSKDLSIFYEMRANVGPREIFELWKAGLTSVQFGIEALSNGVLKRIGKGTSVLQNLQAMRTCAELGIENIANLIVDFPGSTAEEVAETRECILRYAVAYQPCQVSTFHLGIESTVDTLREEFGITNVRNSEAARVGLPEVAWKRLKMFELQYDIAEKASWQPVREACDTWRALHKESPKPLSYQDGGSFLRIVDRRHGSSIVTLPASHRAVYLLCTEARRRDEVVSLLPSHDPGEVLAVLDELTDISLMYREGERHLALAIASRSEDAARRMNATQTSAA